MSRPIARIDRAAFRANLERLQHAFAPAETWLATKSDCYGHGRANLLPVARQAGVDGLAVLDIEGGLAMRADGESSPMFAWMHPHDADFAGALRGDLALGINAAWQLEAIADAARATGIRARVHLKLDTGLHRGGIDEGAWEPLVERALELEREGVVVVEGLWTHLSDTSHAVDEASIARFESGVARARDLGARPSVLHAAASGAGIDFPAARYDLVRLGIAAYGVSPFEDRTAADLGLRPVMTLEARVDRLEGGLAILGAGFGDGLPALPFDGAGIAPDERGRGPFVVLRGGALPVRRIDVDEMAIELGPLRDEARPGETALIFGEGAASAEQWAHWCGTVADELLTGLTARVARVARA